MPKATRKPKGNKPVQLQMEVEQVASVAAVPVEVSLELELAADEPASQSTYVEDGAPGEPFGRWLLQRKAKGDDSLIGLLAAAAAADPSFPKAGTPDQVRRHLGTRGADGDMFEAVDDAESAWLAA